MVIVSSEQWVWRVKSTRTYKRTDSHFLDLGTDSRTWIWLQFSRPKSRHYLQGFNELFQTQMRTANSAYTGSHFCSTHFIQYPPTMSIGLLLRPNFAVKSYNFRLIKLVNKRRKAKKWTPSPLFLFFASNLLNDIMGNASCGNVKYADQDFLRAVQDGHELGVLHHIQKGCDVNRRSRCHQVWCQKQVDSCLNRPLYLFQSTLTYHMTTGLIQGLSQTPLMVAASYGQLKCAEMLLDSKADINTIDEVDCNFHCEVYLLFSSESCCSCHHRRQSVISSNFWLFSSF